MTTISSKEIREMAEDLLKVHKQVALYYLENLDNLSVAQEMQIKLLRNNLLTMYQDLIIYDGSIKAEELTKSAAEIKPIIVEIADSIQRIQNVGAALDIIGDALEIAQGLLSSDPNMIMKGVTEASAKINEL